MTNNYLKGQMKILKQYWLVLAILVVVAVAVLVRTFGHGNFKYDAGKLAEPSVLRTNIITKDQITGLRGRVMIIDLREAGTNNDKFPTSLKVSPDSILAKKYLNMIRKQRGPVVLTGSDYSVSARIWMVLSQMGIKDIYILSGESNPEILKKEFRPDTISAPEL
jgi:hypothetical protein